MITRNRPPVLKSGAGWANANLRTRFQKIIKLAGLKPWPRLLHNLRASRQTELADQYPEHVACLWIGNSKTVAREHYLSITPEHMQRAIEGVSLPGVMPHGDDLGSIEPQSEIRLNVDDSRNSSQYKKKRPHATVQKRRIEDTSRTFCRRRTEVGPCRNQPFISVFHRNCASIMSVAAAFIEMSWTHFSPTGGR